MQDRFPIGELIKDISVACVDFLTLTVQLFQHKLYVVSCFEHNSLY